MPLSVQYLRQTIEEAVDVLVGASVDDQAHVTMPDMMDRQ